MIYTVDETSLFKFENSSYGNIFEAYRTHCGNAQSLPFSKALINLELLLCTGIKPLQHNQWVLMNHQKLPNRPLIELHYFVLFL